MQIFDKHAPSARDKGLWVEVSTAPLWFGVRNLRMSAGKHVLADAARARRAAEVGAEAADGDVRDAAVGGYRARDWGEGGGGGARVGVEYGEWV